MKTVHRIFVQACLLQTWFVVVKKKNTTKKQYSLRMNYGIFIPVHSRQLLRKESIGAMQVTSTSVHNIPFCKIDFKKPLYNIPAVEL